MINSHSRAHHSRVALLDSERSKHIHRDLVLGSYRLKNVDHILEMTFIIEGQRRMEFADEIDEAMLRWVSGFRKAVHPHALSVSERTFSGVALSRYRTKCEPYPAIRGRNVNILA